MVTNQNQRKGWIGMRGAVIWSGALAMALGVSVGLVGCGGGSEEQPGNGSGSGSGTAATSGQGGAGAAGASGDQATPSAAGAEGMSGASGDADASNDTVDGTLTLFISAMEDGDFAEAATLVDPTTELHDELLSLLDVIAQASARDDAQGVDAASMIRMSFQLRFAGATHEVVSEEGSRARAVFILPQAGDARRQVSLNQVDGAWYIVAGSDLLSASGGSGAPAPRPRPTPQPRPTPAPEPEPEPAPDPQ
ncbi:MAG: hypothetical protein ACTS3F_10010 [Phycisphaerales bacterium]